MSVPGFGVSTQDVVFFCTVILTAVNALQKTGKVSREYKQLQQHLSGLKSQMVIIDELKSTEAQAHPHCEALLENAVKGCENTLNDFLRQHQKYFPHLENKASSKPRMSWERLNEMIMRVHWAQFHANDIKQLQDQLIMHLGLISVALNTWKLFAGPSDTSLVHFC